MSPRWIGAYLCPVDSTLCGTATKDDLDVCVFGAPPDVELVSTADPHTGSIVQADVFPTCTADDRLSGAHELSELLQRSSDATSTFRAWS